MSLPTETPTGSFGLGDGGASLGEAAVLDSPERDPFLYWSPRWCANCEGEQTFVPVDRFPFGWRGYCLICEGVVYAMNNRTNSEEAA